MPQIIQLTGLSGAGKTTLAYALKTALATHAVDLDVVDGDKFRKTLCRDLGFSKADRMENIHRLAAYSANRLTSHVVIIAAINPYEATRQTVARLYQAKTVWVKCGLDELIRRDTKGLYRRALLPENHADRLPNLSGINDCYEEPQCPDLIIETDKQPEDTCIGQLAQFVLRLFDGRPKP